MIYPLTGQAKPCVTKTACSNQIGESYTVIFAINNLPADKKLEVGVGKVNTDGSVTLLYNIVSGSRGSINYSNTFTNLGAIGSGNRKVWLQINEHGVKVEEESMTTSGVPLEDEAPPEGNE